MNNTGTYDPYSQGYQGGSSAYQEGYGYNQNYNYNYNQSYGTTNSSSAGVEYPQGWGSTYNQQGVQPVSTSTSSEAVVHEMQQQKAQLHMQRSEYVKKVLVLRRELESLRTQKQNLLTASSPPRDVDSIVQENDRLQEEILTKMKAITNVIEMLSGIIKDGLKLADLEKQLQEESPSRSMKAKSKSPSKQIIDGSVKYNYVHYDPELHWCRMCDKFPKSAKEFLIHLQSKKHLDNVNENDVGDNTPWHKLPAEPELPHYDGASKKRIPIKGLQFFIATPAWYCKLCDVWIGDLHCASQHLKSQTHFQNYQIFVEQNPHWEMEWFKDREKAFSRIEKKDDDSSGSDESSKKKRKNKRHNDFDKKDKKKKKHSKKRKKQKRGSDSSSSSSSSSDSSSEDDKDDDKSKSIRVAMRNIKAESILNENLGEKLEMLNRLMDEQKKKKEIINKEMETRRSETHTKNDSLLNQWMTVREAPEKEKYLLDSLKDRMKQKQTIEKAKYDEIERRQREREIKEREEKERKEREEREKFERMEAERKERERLEYERIIDKDRDQVKFKQTVREKYIRKRTPSPSPERETKERREVQKAQEKESPQEYRSRDRDKQKSNSRDRDSRHSPERSRKYSRENGSRRSRSYSRSPPPSRYKSENEKKRGHGSSSHKKLPFIGRMPLFKNKKPESDRVEREIKKEEYEKPRVTRFEPGNLPRAFIPDPEVVCFPRLSSYPELSIPPPKTVTPVKEVKPPSKPPAPPKISEEPPSKQKKADTSKENSNPTETNYKSTGMEFASDDFDPNMYEDPTDMLKQWATPQMNMEQWYQSQQQMYQYENPSSEGASEVPLAHTMPLLPPPLPPGDDDLAMLGISADDMAAQSF